MKTDVPPSARRARMTRMRHALILTALLVALPAGPALRAAPARPARPALPAPPALPVPKGPEHGALVIVGGGKVGNEIMTRMFDLAGGKDVPLVVIPTASGADDYPADWPGLRMFKTFGA